MATAAIYISRPSLARVVCIEGFGPQIRGQALSTTPLNWPVKDPADLLDYVMDTSAAFFGVETDGIVSLDVSVSPQETQGLTLESCAVDGERAVMWFSGGVPGHDYIVTVSIGTAGGRYLLRGATLPVQSLSPMIYPVSNDLVDGYNNPLIDQKRNPLLSS